MCLAATAPKSNIQATARGKPLQGNYEFDFDAISVSSPILCFVFGLYPPRAVIAQLHISLEADKAIRSSLSFSQR